MGSPTPRPRASPRGMPRGSLRLRNYPCARNPALHALNRECGARWHHPRHRGPTGPRNGRQPSRPPELEMLTPKGEHSFPLFYQGDVRWENQSRRNRNRQNFVVESYFLTALQSSKNPNALFLVVTCSRGATCGKRDFSVNPVNKAKKSIFPLRISLQHTQK